jgi:hypothetical protein
MNKNLGKWRAGFEGAAIVETMQLSAAFREVAGKENASQIIHAASEFLNSTNVTGGSLCGKYTTAYR